MTKRIILTIVGLVLLVGILGGIKGLQFSKMAKQGAQFVPPPQPVTVAVLKKESWESTLTSVGTLSAVQGITVTAELTGKVVHIAFTAGTPVNVGDLLVQQDTSAELAQLRAVEAKVALEKANMARLRNLLKGKSIAQSQYDDTEAQYKQAMAQADEIRTTISKKTIRAPFTGNLGIRLVNLGQILKEGDGIVSLQALDPIFVDFSLPQQQLSQVRPGLPVRVITDALPDQVVEGSITAINPEVDAATRNIKIQATVRNPDADLRPGMYVTVEVVLPARNEVIALPATAVVYAPYSDSVFVVEDKKDEKSGQGGKVIRQQFVKLGKERGDYVAVLSGLEGNETVVSTGVFKLRNGQSVVVDNTLAPEFKLSPKPENN